MAEPSSPEPPYEVLAVRFGTVTTERSDVFLGAGDGDQRLDFYLWLARNERRTVLIDTGFSVRGARRRGRRPLQDPAELLAGLLGEDEPDLVVLTHLHYDHAGNLGFLRTAPIAIAAREVGFWLGPEPVEPALGRFTDADDLDAVAAADAAGRLRAFSERSEVAPGVIAERVGGHTPGQLIVRVAAAGGEVVIASDALHFYEELDAELTYATTFDPGEARAAVARLRELARDGAAIVPGHDPLVAARHPETGPSIFRLA